MALNPLHENFEEFKKEENLDHKCSKIGLADA